ncbi:MAG: ABC transporter permease [Phycisphaerales bacterium]
MAKRRQPNVPQTAVPAMAAPPVERDNPLTRSLAGVIGMGFLAFMLLVCLVGLFWTLAPASTTYPGVSAGADGKVTVPRYNAGSAEYGRLPPWWAVRDESALKLNMLVPAETVEGLAREFRVSPMEVRQATDGEIAKAIRRHWVYNGNRVSMLLGTDVLGRSLLYRVMTGGGISLGIGLSAAFISVLIGTLYGALSGYAGGKTDAAMMRIVDVLFGLPYILLVVLLAVASDAAIDEFETRQKSRTSWERGVMNEVLVARGEPATDAARRSWREDAFAPSGALANLDVAEPVADARQRVVDIAQGDDPAGAVPLTNAQVMDAMALAARPPRDLADSTRLVLDLVVLLVAIGGVSWLTMARVIRGQVLSLKNQPFIEAARSAGAPTRRIFLVHLLPNLLGPIIVYATLTVPLAILQESFLSFLGIGVKPPLPSWGNLAADGLNELNPYESLWWLILFPCLLLGATLLALNFVGEGLREAFDPKRGRR